MARATTRSGSESLSASIAREYIPQSHAIKFMQNFYAQIIKSASIQTYDRHNVHVVWLSGQYLCSHAALPKCDIYNSLLGNIRKQEHTVCELSILYSRCAQLLPANLDYLRPTLTEPLTKTRTQINIWFSAYVLQSTPGDDTLDYFICLEWQDIVL